MLKLLQILVFYNINLTNGFDNKYKGKFHSQPLKFGLMST